MVIKTLTLIGLIVSCLYLTGCDRNQPEDMLENYTSRVSRVLEVDKPLPPAPEIPLFPQRRDRIIPTQEIREGLLDVLNLKRCNLLPLIAERNSSLGKVYPASQKMVYELKFFDAVRSCLTTVKFDNDDPELLAQLSDIYEIKSANLTAEIWNGIYTSSEVENNFSIGEQPLPLEPDGASSTMLEAFSTLSSLSNLVKDHPQWKLPAFIYDIEPLYEHLHRNRSGAQSLASLQLVTRYLNHSANLIELHLEKKPICFNGKISQKAKILQNVFYKYYAGEVQPYMVQVHNSSKTWLDLNNSLFDNLISGGLNLSPSVITFKQKVLNRNSESGLWSEYESARDRHVQAWQAVLKQCGMMPSR